MKTDAKMNDFKEPYGYMASTCCLARRWWGELREAYFQGEHLSYQKKEPASESRSISEQLPDIRLWALLEEAGALQMKELGLAFQAAAPHPGSLLYLEPKRLELHWDELQPILFRAIDVCTHLQVVRLYLTDTVASAVDFLQFTIEQLPFTIGEVRTPVDPLFTDTSIHQREHRFTSAASKRSIVHSILSAPSKDPVISVLSNYLFGNLPVGMLEETSEARFMADLTNFIYFHNNHRSLPTLGGKTPLQMLRTFPEFASNTAFDPSEFGFQSSSGPARASKP